VLKITPFATLGLAALCITSFSSPAWAAFDADGNYYCNSDNLPLEQTIYKSSVAKVDDALNSYLSLNPDASDQELHNYLISSPDVAQPYSIMEQSKACLQSNGISPSLIATPSSLMLEAFAAPEFGFSGLILAVVFVVLLMQARINKINKIAQ